MHSILERIYATGTVTDGTATYSALNPLSRRPTHIDRTEGELLQTLVADVRPVTTLEVGMAYGVSTLFICDALAALGSSATHIAIDPFQSEQWHRVGLRNLEAAGYAGILRFFEEPSEYCLPRLAQDGTTIQLAFIDGRHTFDQCTLEFYYIDRMLPVGGVVVFDDVTWPAIRRAVRYVLSRGMYEVIRHTGASQTRATLRGRARRTLARLELARRVLNRDWLIRDWDLGIAGSCVAVRKVRPEDPQYGKSRAFVEF
jgi:predicted O-methyltransferase YrrM